MAGPFEGFGVEFTPTGFVIVAPDGSEQVVAWEDVAETEYAALIEKAQRDEAACETWQEARV